MSCTLYRCRRIEIKRLERERGIERIIESCLFCKGTVFEFVQTVLQTLQNSVLNTVENMEGGNSKKSIPTLKFPKSDFSG